MGHRPPIPGLAEIVFKMRKSTTVDLRWLVVLAPFG
jgi:hypothetical protein